MAGASETTGWHRRPDEHARRPCAEFSEVDYSSALNWYTTFVELPFTVSIPILIVPLLVLTIILVMTGGRGEHHLRANDNVATAAIRLIGGAFIFVSALSTASLWQESSRVADTIGHEFGYASVFVNHLDAQNIAGAEDLMNGLRTYATIVMAGELTTSQVATIEDGANEQVSQVTRRIIELDEAGALDTDDVSVLLDSLAGMTMARNSRLSQPYPPLPIFSLVALLGVFTIIVAAVYPTGPDRRLKLLQSLASFAVVASLLSTVMFMLNGDSGWLREHRLRPAEIFVEESYAPSLPPAP